jgi:hypothetical protein
VIKSLSLLPIITPPFVIGLSIILLFGLSGNVTQFVAGVFGLEPTRWVYGFSGVLIAQLLSFTPIAFLVLIGVVEAISPSLEEAAQTLRAGAWETFQVRHLAADAPGAGKCLPARLHREHGRFRQSAGAGGQLQRVVDRDLLLGRRRAERPGPGGRAGHHPAAVHDRRVLPAAKLAWPAQLHLGQRQGRWRHASRRCPDASPSRWS